MFLILSLSFLVHQSQLSVILTISGCIDFALVGLIFHVSSMFSYQSLCLILLGVSQLFLLVAVSSHLIIRFSTLVFILQNVDDVNIVLLLTTLTFIRVVILIVPLTRRNHLLVLVVDGI